MLRKILIVLVGLLALTKLSAANFPHLTGESMNWKAEAEVGIDLASAYIADGVTYNNGPVLQPSLTLSGLPVVFGVWANYDLSDYDGQVTRNEFSEVDLRAAVPFDIGPVSLSADYVAWTYPNSESEADQMFEFSVESPVFKTLSLGLMGRYLFAGGYDGGWYVRPSTRFEIFLAEVLNLNLHACAAYIDRPDGGKDGWQHYDIGATLALGIFNASATYIGRFDREVQPTGTFSYDTQWLFTLGAALHY